jgi:hypothetical protein
MAPTTSPNWLQIGLTILTTVPGIIAQVEAANPGLPGETKKTIVLDQIKTALTDAEPVVGQLLANDPQTMAIFSTVVDAAVDYYNRTAVLLANSAGVTAKALVAGTTQVAPSTGAQ